MIKKNQALSNIVAPISLGELIDKITILEIKKENMTGPQVKNVEKELVSLNQANPVISVKSVLFSADSAKPKRSSYLVSSPAFKFPNQ